MIGDTDLYFGPDIVIPLRAGCGFEEDWQEVGEVTFRETFGGEAHVLRPGHKTKYHLTITAGSNAVWRVPAIADIPPGSLITVHTIKEWTSKIPAGTKQCILSRPPVPGSVWVYDPANPDIRYPFTQDEEDSRIVKIAANATKHLAVGHKHIITGLRGPMTGQQNFLSGLGTWSLELREWKAPA
jgi:hypothetical protein